MKILNSILCLDDGVFKDRRQTLGITLLAILPGVLFLLCRSTHIDGDAAIYADNILKLRLEDISIHVGYYLIGKVVYYSAGLLNVPIDQGLILLSVFLGGLGTIYAFLLVREFTENNMVSTLSAAIMAFSGYYFAYSTKAEVYVPQTFFVISSAYYFARRKVLLAGGIFGIAVLFSPLSAFVGTYFLYDVFSKKLTWRKLGLLVLAASLVFVPVFSVVANEYLWGRRGLLKIGLGTSSPPFYIILKNLCTYLFKSFHILSPALIVGSVCLLLRHRRFFTFLLIMIFSQSVLIYKASEAETVGTFLLQACVFIAAIVGYGVYSISGFLSKSGKVRSYLLSALLAVYAFTTVLMQIGISGLSSAALTKENEFADAVRTFHSSLRSGDVLLTTFWDGTAYAFYTRSDTSEELETTMGNKRWMDIMRLNRKVFDSLVKVGREVYVLEGYSPSPGAELFLSKRVLNDRYNRLSLKKKAETLGPDVALKEYLRAGEVLIYKLDHGDSAGTPSFDLNHR